MEPQKINPIPPSPIPVDPPEMELRRTWFPVNKFYRGGNMLKTILSFLKDRLKEGSTWIAVTILAAFGMSGTLANEVVDLVVQVLAVLIAILPDKQKVTEGTVSNGDTAG